MSQIFQTGAVFENWSGNIRSGSYHVWGCKSSGILSLLLSWLLSLPFCSRPPMSLWFGLQGLKKASAYSEHIPQPSSQCNQAAAMADSSSSLGQQWQETCRLFCHPFRQSCAVPEEEVTRFSPPYYSITSLASCGSF